MKLKYFFLAIFFILLLIICYASLKEIQTNYPTDGNIIVNTPEEQHRVLGGL